MEKLIVFYQIPEKKKKNGIKINSSIKSKITNHMQKSYKIKFRSNKR